MTGLVISTTLPQDPRFGVQYGLDADHLREEIDLAHRIIKSESAVYLLRKLGHSALSNELEATLERVREWVRELHDSLASKAASNLVAARMVAVANDLAAGLRELDPKERRDLAGRGPGPLAYVRLAHDRLEGILAFTPLGGVPVSSGCAAELSHITAIRSS